MNVQEGTQNPRNLLRGLIGGALGGVAMKLVVHAIDPDSFGLSRATDARAARRCCDLMGLPHPDPTRAEQIGAAMHYGLAVVTGLAYAAAGDRIGGGRAIRAVAFGTALWIIGDEIAMSVSGLENPAEVPIASHLSAFGAHLLYGAVLEATLSRD